MKDVTQSSPLESASRVIRVLEVLSSAGGNLSLSELAGRLGLPKSSVHRLLAVLMAHGLVEQDASTKRYQLGMKVFEIGSSVIHRIGLHQAAHPILEELAVRTGETCHLAMLSGVEAVYVYKIDGHSSIIMSSRVGKRAPCHCTSIGKVLIAWGGDDLFRRVIWAGLQRYTRRTITRESELAMELERVRRQGYAIDREEYEDGLSCVAAPIRDHSARVVAAVGIAAPAWRVTEDHLPSLANMVSSSAQAISRNLGYSEQKRLVI